MPILTHLGSGDLVHGKVEGEQMVSYNKKYFKRSNSTMVSVLQLSMVGGLAIASI